MRAAFLQADRHDFTVLENLFPFELSLELRSRNFGAQPRRFALVVEYDTFDRVPVVRQRDIPPDRPPKSGAPNRDHVADTPLVVFADEYGQFPFGGRLVVFGFQVRQQSERVRPFDLISFDVDGITVHNVFFILLVDIGRFVRRLVRIAAFADRAQDIAHFLDSHVLGLNIFQRQRSKREHRRHDHHHDRSISDNIRITVLIHTPTLFS